MAEDKPKPFFDDEKKKRALEWIKARCTDGQFKCECCQHQQWSLSEDITTPVNFVGGLYFGGNAYPHIMAMCTHCGNTKFFNAVIMGILSDPAEEKKEGENG